MSKSIDFLVGGVPRGGTTVAGKVFNLHPDTYCYATETHWLSLLMEFAQFESVPRALLSDVERIALEANRQALINMARFSASRRGEDQPTIFQERDLLPLTKAMISLMRKGLYGRALCEATLPILRRHLVKKTGKNIVGEKTPNNVFAFDAFGTLGTKATYMVLREPYAVVRSMRNRGADATDAYASAFRHDLMTLIGTWNSYVEAILDAQRHERTETLTYEGMIERPSATTEQMFNRIGLTVDDTVLAAANELLQEVTPGPPWKSMSGPEQALIWFLTKHLRERVGYDEEFYSRRGFDSAALHDKLSLEGDRVMPFGGVNSSAPSERALLLRKDGCLALQTSTGRKSVTLRLWSNFPPSVAPIARTAKISFSTYGIFSRPLATAEAPCGKPSTTTIRLNLADIEPSATSRSGEIRLVSFNASHAYRGYQTLIPKKRQFGLIKHVKFVPRARDRRQTSFALTGAEFH